MFVCDEPCMEDDGTGKDCQGAVEYRMSLSGTGRAIPRCDKHWDARLRKEDEINRRYPPQPPSDWSPDDAGESWDEDKW